MSFSGRTSAAATMKPVVGSAHHSAWSIGVSRGALSACARIAWQHLVVDDAAQLLGGDEAVARGVVGGLGVVQVVEQPGQRPAIGVGLGESETLGERAHDDLGRNAVVDQVALRDALGDERVGLVASDHEAAPGSAFAASIRAASHSAHSSTPSPLVAAMRKIGAEGLSDFTTPRELLLVEVEVRHRVDLVEDDRLGDLEDARVLVRLVVALGHRQDHDLRVLAQVEVGGTHQVADVLDDDQVELLERQRVDRALDHVALEVAGAAGVDLDRRDAVRLDLLGVDLARDVALDDRDAVAVAQGRDGGQDRRGLARARRGHQVEHEDARGVEPRAVLGGEALVAVEDRFAQVDFHAHSSEVSTVSSAGSASASPRRSLPSSASMLSIRSSLPVSGSTLKLPHAGQSISNRS